MNTNQSIYPPSGAPPTYNPSYQYNAAVPAASPFIIVENNIPSTQFQAAPQREASCSSKSSCNNDSSPIFMFDMKEVFAVEERSGCMRGFLNVSNRIYRACYKALFIATLAFGFLFIPFIGMMAGFWDVFITMGWRPFSRPIGRLAADTLGYSNRQPTYIIINHTGDPSKLHSV